MGRMICQLLYCWQCAKSLIDRFIANDGNQIPVQKERDLSPVGIDPFGLFSYLSRSCFFFGFRFSSDATGFDCACRSLASRDTLSDFF